MATAAVAPRVMELLTPLGKDALLFHRMTVEEALGEMPGYHIVALAPKPDIEAEQLLGKTITVKVELPQGGPRCFDAMVTRFSMGPAQGRYHTYHIEARPWLWLLTQTSDCRIFQNAKVPDIVKTILDKYPKGQYELRLTGDYRPWEYCVQYRETDFNFVSRLLEQEGIYYYFEHTEGKHVLVLADSLSAHEPYPGYESLPFVASDRGGSRLDRESVSEWSFEKSVITGNFVVDDYDFERPGVELQQKFHLARAHEEASHEFYDYPGEYVQADEGRHFVRTRLEALQCRYETCDAGGNARGVAAGHLFKLTGHPRADQNKEYLVVSTAIQCSHGGYEGIAGEGASFRCGFTAIGSKEPFRPLRRADKPVVKGPQTAVVVGPSGDEIHTDKYGRVKVQFHWDRYGKKNENSSCWVRVSQPWAGKNWGFMQVPRIGQEVIVDFLEGDPDQPIITGRVYNAEQMPPWDLPANATQSGVLSRSSKGGSPANANAIRFEDKKGAEQLWIHAEKNQDVEVEADETHWVGHDRTKTVDHDETVHVKHDRTETVGNDETITIGVNRTEKVGANESITIGADRTETVGANETISIGSSRTETVGSSETVSIALTRTHNVGVAEALNVGGARSQNVGGAESVAIGGAQSIVVGAIRSVQVGARQSHAVGGDDQLTVGGARSVSVSRDSALDVAGNATVKIGKNQSTQVAEDWAVKVGKNLVIDATDSITIQSGSASIVLKKDGTVIIKGKDISVEGSGKIKINASSDVTIKGSKVGVN